MGRNTRIIFKFARISGIVSFLVFSLYFLQNDSGHTGINYILGIYINFSMMMADLVVCRRFMAITAYLPYIILAAVLYYGEYLLPYSEWLDRGFA